jgi:hypothetical protein
MVCEMQTCKPAFNVLLQQVRMRSPLSMCASSSDAFLLVLETDKRSEYK